MVYRVMVTTNSLVARQKEKGDQDVLLHVDVKKLNAIFSKAFAPTIKNLHGYYKKLLYMTRERGGLDMSIFSGRKLQKLFIYLRSQHQHAHASGRALSRKVRKHRYYAIIAKKDEYIG